MSLSGTIGPKTTPAGTADNPAPYRPAVAGGGPSASAGFMPGTAPSPAASGAAPGAQQETRRSALDSLGETGSAEAAGQPDIAERIAAAARRDRVARDERRAARAEREALRAERGRVQARAAELDAQVKTSAEQRARYQKDPAALLQDYGWQPETALQYMVQGQKLTPEQKLAELESELQQTRQMTQKEVQDLEQRTAQALAEREAEQTKQADQARQSQVQAAVEAMKGDIAEVIAGDQNLKLMRTAGPRGVEAVYARIEQWSDRAYQQSGRRPLITTKVIEAAVADIETEARDEIRERVLSDPDLLRDMGVLPGVRMAPAPRTIAQNMPPAPGVQRQQQEQQRRETDSERRARVVAALEALRIRNGGSLR